ncbi:hypothetical protein QJS10_CPB15g01474 [Acorus calamus]|uniref:Uncharacterized protein n=1 Tax=Acorus calamus TaxID=4465 RepID=A0AAV9D7U4_ACOCL|nr:hypothetical protein QJS10_CPB15g01474 [Acorus calamus]
MSSLLVGIMMAKKNARKSVHRMKKSKRMEKMCKIEKALEDSECSRKVERQIETALEDLEYHEDIVDPMEDGYTCTYDEFEEAPDGGPKDIYDKLDLRELKEKHPNVEEESLILSLEARNIPSFYPLA